MYFTFYETILDGIVAKGFQDQLNGISAYISTLRAYEKCTPAYFHQSRTQQIHLQLEIEVHFPSLFQMGALHSKQRL